MCKNFPFLDLRKIEDILPCLIFGWKCSSQVNHVKSLVASEVPFVIEEKYDYLVYLRYLQQHKGAWVRSFRCNAALNLFVISEIRLQLTHHVCARFDLFTENGVCIYCPPSVRTAILKDEILVNTRITTKGFL